MEDSGEGRWWCVTRGGKDLSSQSCLPAAAFAGSKVARQVHTRWPRLPAACLGPEPTSWSTRSRSPGAIDRATDLVNSSQFT